MWLLSLESNAQVTTAKHIATVIPGWFTTCVESSMITNRLQTLKC